MNNFTEVLRNRRSVRKFKDKEVPIGLIERIIEDATYAPTNCNQQLWKFIVITQQSIKDRLVNEAFSNTNIANAPVVIVGIYDSWDYKEAIQGASMATQNILLSATNLCLGIYPMNSYGNDKIVKNILKIPSNYVINCFILLGYAEDFYKTISHVNRRPYKEILCLNEFKSVFPPERSYDPEKWSKELLTDYQKYYCRKTFLGKEMDIMDNLERKLVKDVLSIIPNQHKIVDFFSYDGCYLNLFPNNFITSINLESETQKYVEASVDIYAQDKKLKIDYGLYDTFSQKYDIATIIFKIERLPKELRYDLYEKVNNSLTTNGRLLIIARKHSLIFNLYYLTIKILFGDDIRKTGLYAFWGPYKPLKNRKLLRELSENGFIIKKVEKYFPIPPFFNQVLQMFLQWKKSGGTSYLHRKKHKNLFTKILKFFIQRKTISSTIFGTLIVLEAEKNAK